MDDKYELLDPSGLQRTARRQQLKGNISGAKKEPKPKLFGPDILGWGGVLPRERMGAKKFGMSLETREIKLFGRDIPGFCWDIPVVPEKFEKKNLCSIFGPNIVSEHFITFPSELRLRW